MWSIGPIQVGQASYRKGRRKARARGIECVGYAGHAPQVFFYPDQYPEIYHGCKVETEREVETYTDIYELINHGEAAQ